MSYRTIILPQAVKMLKAIADHRVREKIMQRIDGLAEEPLQQGKPLLGPLMGYRSLRAVGQRYRIIYRVKEDQVLVLVIAVGIRKQGDKQDIYALARKLLRLHLVESPPSKKDSH